ncbi:MULTISPECIES: sulfur oxidation c-type cytochrome SoxX [Rhodomicrobium]|uniref:sulfur oxidation c-type cytochrome SoxX n=1 Tax=Rhodomicrobium TaxID=1068 RepID=UPI0014839468|nr:MULTISPECIES: sulfur oxidation c-type cytochrome SoxX [Rhodomicrobium]
MRTKKPAMAAAMLAAAIASLSAHESRAGGALADFQIAGDAIPAPLAGLTGDAARGLTIIRDRAVGNCLICHALPLPDELFQGEIGPSLGGVGNRLTAGQIRLRLVDQSRINAETVMPPYYRVGGLTNVAADYRGRPALDAQQIEDVVAYLAGLKE